MFRSKQIKSQRDERESNTEDGVNGVHGDLILGGVADQSLGIGEGDIGRSRPVALVVGDDLDAVVLPDPNAGVGGAEIYTDRWSLSLSGHCFSFFFFSSAASATV